MDRTIKVVLLAVAVAMIPVAAAIGQDFLRFSGNQIAVDAKESSGVAWIDYDGNGTQDVFVASRGGQTNDLYHNTSDGWFIRGIYGSHLFTHLMNASGMSWGDIDNDGDADVIVTNLSGPNFFYLNGGNGSFSLVTTGAIANDNNDSRSAAWADYDNDGYLDLFVANRFGEPNSLYHNNGNGTFNRITSGPIATDTGDANSGTWADYDNDGDVDLFVANGSSQTDALYRNDGGGAFVSIEGDPVVTTVATSGGGSWADYDNDGDLDLYVTVTRGRNLFYRNTGDESFEALEDVVILGEDEDTHGASWGDLNNDGLVDLVIATRLGPDGHVYMNNGDGSFAELFRGLYEQGGNSQGAALSDFDHDGDLDLVVVNQGNEQNFLLTNQLASGNWLSIRLIGTASNRMAIGSRISVSTKIAGNVVTQIREIATLTGLGGQNDLAAFFGLGNAQIVNEIQITWPSGEVSVYNDILANRRLQIIESGSVDAEETPNRSDFAGVAEMSIWPNPVASQASIRLRSDHNQGVRVSVWDAVGRQALVLHDGPINATQDLDLTLGTEQLTNGIYFVKVEGDYGTSTRSVVIMK